MTVNNEGSIVQFRAENKRELKYMQQNVQAEPWQWLGDTLCVDHHYASDLIELFTVEGFFGE